MNQHFREDSHGGAKLVAQSAEGDACDCRQCGDTDPSPVLSWCDVCYGPLAPRCDCHSAARPAPNHEWNDVARAYRRLEAGDASGLRLLETVLNEAWPMWRLRGSW